MKTQPWVLLAATLAAALLLTVQSPWRRGPAEVGTPEESAPPPAAVETSPCDVARTRCSGESDGVRLDLALGPGVKALTPFPVQLQLTGPAGLAADRVTVDFTMPAMEMGRNRYRLLPAGGGGWHGQATLPICTSGSMEWLATVAAWSGERQVARAEFPFVMGE